MQNIMPTAFYDVFRRGALTRGCSALLFLVLILIGFFAAAPTHATVTVLISPSSDSVCSGTSEAFHAVVGVSDSEDDGSAMTYTWFVNGIQQSNSNSASFLYTFPYGGTFHVDCSVSGIDGGSAGSNHAIITVTSSQMFVTTSGGTPNPATTCSSVSFEAFAEESCGSGNILYLWDFGDGTGGNGATVSHTYSSPGPLANNQYSVTVNAVDPDHSSVSHTFLITVNPGLPPGTPINLHATSSSPPFVDLDWTASYLGSYDGTCKIYRSDNGGTFTQIGTWSGTHYQDRTALANSAYCYFVKAVNDCGTEGSGSNIACVSGSGCSLTISGASASSTSVTLNQSVQFQADAVDSCNRSITYSWDFGDGSTGIGATVTHGYSFPGTYNAILTASAGSTTQTQHIVVTVTGTQTSAPGIPLNLTATPGNAQVVLSWNAPSGTVSGYNIYRGTSAGNENTTAIATTVTPGYTDPDVSNGTTYYYVVTAVNSVGESGYSNEASATPNASSTDYLYRINAGGGAVAPFVADQYSSGGTIIASGNTVDLSGVSNPAPMAVYQSGRFGTFSYTLPGMTSGSVHGVRLHFAELEYSQSGNRVFNVTLNGVLVLDAFDPVAAAGGGNKAVVREFNTTVDSSGHIVLQFAPTPNSPDQMASIEGIEVLNAPLSVLPSGPLNLQAVAENAQVSLNWNAVSSATSYKVYRSTTSGSETFLASPSGTGTTYTDTGLANGTTYYYKVAAVNSGGESLLSNEASATPSNQAPTVATAASADPNPVTGTTTTLSVLGADDAGESNLTYSWATLGSPPATVTFSGNGTNASKNTTATFTKAGSYTFQVTITDEGNLTAISTVTVTVNQTLTGISIVPATASVPVNTTQQFTATALDQFSTSLTPQPSFTWTTDGGGTIDENGLFTAGATAGGPHTITAASGSVNGTALVTVTAPINAAPTIATIASANPNPVTGTTTALSVLGADDGGESNLTYTWATIGAPAAVTFSENGTNAAKNTTATFTAAGIYTFLVTIQDTANLTVTSSVIVIVDSTLTTIAVDPTTANIPANTTQQFTAIGSDQFAAILTAQPVFTWTASGGGTIDANGLFTAGETAGGPHTITAASGSANGTASITVAVAITLSSISLSTSSVPGGNPLTGTVTLTGNAPLGGITVNLASDNGAATVPATIAIPMGQASIDFPITTTSVTSNVVAHISATYADVIKSADLTITPVTLSSISLNATSTAGGYSLLGFVELTGPAPVDGVTVSLSSDNGVATVQSTVFVAEGHTSAYFTVFTTPVPSTVTANISAAYADVTKSVALTIEAPTLLSINPSAASVIGGDSFSGTVALTSYAPAGGVTVNLSSDNGVATVPATVTIASGSDRASFTVTTTSVAASVVANISANYADVTKSLALTVTPISVSSISFDPFSVVGGNSSSGTVTLAHIAPIGGIVVGLSSDNPNATVPASVLVPAGETSANFSATTIAVTATVTANISAAYAGGTKSAELVITPVALASITLDHPSLVGGNPTSGEVTLSSVAPAGGISVTLQSDNAAATVPATVTVPEGAITAPFTLSTTLVTSVTDTTITGTYLNVCTADLTIYPHPLASLTIEPTSVFGGTSSTGTVTLTGLEENPGFVVNLSANNAFVSVPTSIQIPIGQSSVSFTISTRIVSDAQIVTITAACEGQTVTAPLILLPARGIIEGPTGVPTGLTATAISSGEIDLSWSSSDNTTGFIVEKSLDGSSSWMQIATLPSTSTTYASTGLNSETRYYYRIAVPQSGSELDYSNIADATTLAKAPANAFNLTATAFDSKVYLIWNPILGAKSYTIKRRITGETQYTVVGTSSGVNHFTDVGLTNGVTYFYVVSGSNLAGEGLNSNEVSATPGLIDGAAPYSNVSVGVDGTIYGTTASGGDTSKGTIFKISNLGVMTTMQSFAGFSFHFGSLGSLDGAYSYAGLTYPGDGSMYGTTALGGAFGNGSIFKLDNTGVGQTFYSFTNYNDDGVNLDGANPHSNLIVGSDGYLYGTNGNGGVNSCGTIFKIDSSSHLTIIHSFTQADDYQVNTDGANPYGGLVQGLDGAFYGTTTVGGTYGKGTVYRIDLNGSFTTLYSFGLQDDYTDGENPYGALVVGSDGSLYGTTSAGGESSNGIVFKIDPAGVFTTLHDFTDFDGSTLYGGLTKGSDGSLYGVATSGGAFGDGTIFKIDPMGTFTSLHSFTGTDGENPYANLVFGLDGKLYGTTVNGGTSGHGAVFSIDTLGNLAVLYSFNSTPGYLPSSP